MNEAFNNLFLLNGRGRRRTRSDAVKPSRWTLYHTDYTKQKSKVLAQTTGQCSTWRSLARAPSSKVTIRSLRAWSAISLTRWRALNRPWLQLLSFPQKFKIRTSPSVSAPAAASSVFQYYNRYLTIGSDISFSNKKNPEDFVMIESLPPPSAQDQ